MGNILLELVPIQRFPLDFLGIYRSDFSQIGYLEPVGGGTDDIRLGSVPSDTIGFSMDPLDRFWVF